MVTSEANPKMGAYFLGTYSRFLDLNQRFDLFFIKIDSIPGNLHNK